MRRPSSIVRVSMPDREDDGFLDSGDVDVAVD
jgi:hypothetical protein